jgi:ATP-dependent RNA helicase DDX42
MLFSATFKKRIEKLALDVLTDPFKIVQGESGEANEDVIQSVMVFDEGPKKWEWLTSKLVEFTAIGSVLIFVTKKTNADELAANLELRDFQLLLIHGDMDQATRNQVITSFKKKEKPILVATDVAARGLDIPHVRTVVNYDIARDIETHTHRVGRTGRAGQSGNAYTLVTEKDKEFAGHLVRNLEGANQFVPPALNELALQSAWFKNSRQGQSGKAKKSSGGLGFKSRPGMSSCPRPSPSSSFAQPSSSYTESVQSKIVNTSNTTDPSSQPSKLSAVRAAFAAQYKNTFKAATESSSSGWKKPEETSKEPEAPKKKSRWN